MPRSLLPLLLLALTSRCGAPRVQPRPAAAAAWTPPRTAAGCLLCGTATGWRVWAGLLTSARRLSEAWSPRCCATARSRPPRCAEQEGGRRREVAGAGGRRRRCGGVRLHGTSCRCSLGVMHAPMHARTRHHQRTNVHAACACGRPDTRLRRTARPSSTFAAGWRAHVPTSPHRAPPQTQHPTDQGQGHPQVRGQDDWAGQGRQPARAPPGPGLHLRPGAGQVAVRAGGGAKGGHLPLLMCNRRWFTLPEAVGGRFHVAGGSGWAVAGWSGRCSSRWGAV